MADATQAAPLRGVDVPTFERRDGAKYAHPLDRWLRRAPGAGSIAVQAGRSGEVSLVAIAHGAITCHTLNLTPAEAAALGAELIAAACYLQTQRAKEAA